MRVEPRAGTLIVRGERVVYASEGVAILLGRRVEDVVGRPYVDFLVPEQRATVEDRNVRRARGERVPRRYEVTVALPDGGRRLVELDVEEDGGDYLVHVRDLTGQQARRLRLDSV